MVNKVVEAIREAANSFGKGNTFSYADIINYIKQNHPDQIWSEPSVRAQTLLLCVNSKNASKTHPSVYKYAFLFHVDMNKYRLYEPEKDGTYTQGDKSALDANIENDMEDEEQLYEISFGFEKDLEEYIFKNLSQIETGLKPYSGKDVTGRQFTIDFGRIDVLTTDSKGNFVVIELKAGIANYKVIGQILSYMNWIRKNVANGKNVRGIVIADDFDERTRYAAQEISSITLKKYKAKFEFEDMK